MWFNILILFWKTIFLFIAIVSFHNYGVHLKWVYILFLADCRSSELSQGSSTHIIKHCAFGIRNVEEFLFLSQDFLWRKFHQFFNTAGVRTNPLCKQVCLCLQRPIVLKLQLRIGLYWIMSIAILISQTNFFLGKNAK